MYGNSTMLTAKQKKLPKALQEAIKAKKSKSTDCQLIPEKIWKDYTLDE